MLTTAADQFNQHFHAAQTALAELHSLPYGCMSPDELAQASHRVTTLNSQVAALTCQVYAAAESACVAQVNKKRTFPQYMAATSNIADHQARTDARLGQWLRDYPDLAAAFAAGAIHRDHLETMRRRLDKPRNVRGLIRDQQIFIDAARDCSFKNFKKVVAYWAIAADPDGDEPKEQIAKTGFSARKQADGSVKVDGYLDPISGQVLLNALDGETQKLFRKDAETKTKRTHRRRAADALLNLMTRGAARADGTFPAPLFQIVMSEKVAEDALERLGEPSLEDLPVSWNDVDQRCELIDGTPIHPHLALATMGVAVLRRHIMDAKSRILDVSVNARLFPRWMKDALLVRSRGSCENEGCEAPFAWLQADHVKPHSKGGLTLLSNGKILCDPDNKHKRDHYDAA